MFDRPHHRRIAKILHALNSNLLQEAECYFAGGTAIALSLGEYRESVDIDFLCASNDGYRLLRNSVTEDGLGALLVEPLKLRRDVQADRYGIRTFIEIDGAPVKIEFVREDRISLDGQYDPVLTVPKLSQSDMYTEKLLANADRGLDKFVKSRDIIDLAMMIDCWGEIPGKALNKAYEAYGDHVIKAFTKSAKMIQDQDYFKGCLKAAHMDEGLIERIPQIINYQLHIIQVNYSSSLEP